MPGRVVRNVGSPFFGGQDKSYRPPQFRVRKGPFCQGLQTPNVSLAGLVRPASVICRQQFSGIAFSEHMLYNKAVSRPRKGLLIFCFVVPKWCPTLQNHAVTGYAGLFTRFEETPISCGFAGCAYDTTCRLMTPGKAIIAIKNDGGFP